MIESLEKIFTIINNEIGNECSLWDKNIIKKVILPEMEDLYAHFVKGEKYFKYGKRQRMLESTYILTDSLEKLADTLLGHQILVIQHIYDKI